MKFDISNATTYAEIAIESHIDYIVFEQMYKIHPLLEFGQKKKKEVYNPASIASIFIKSHIAGITFAAFSIESEINLLGKIVFGSKFYDENVEKNSPISKLCLIDNKKGNEVLKNGIEPFNGLKLLFSERDKYVHDKSVRIVENINYEKVMEKREVRLNTTTAVKVLMSFNDYVNKYYSEEKGVDFISVNNVDRITKWNGDMNFIPLDGELFHDVSFPDKYEYELFVRSHIGYYYK